MPVALDLFCGAGGAAVGLQRAGFDVVGIDHQPQPDYPGAFILGDVLHMPVRLSDFDFVWASPPCQAYSISTVYRREKEGREYPDLIPATRQLLAGHPYTAIENTVGAPLRPDLFLTLPMFGNNTHPHKRIFELSYFAWQPFPLRLGVGMSIVDPTGHSSGSQKALSVVELTRHNTRAEKRGREVVSATGERRMTAGCYYRRREMPMFSKVHIQVIAERFPEFYRKHFPGLVCAAGHGWADAGEGIGQRRKELGMVGTTTLPELRAALDCPHIVTGSHQKVRAALNNAIPPAFSEYIGNAALAAMARSRE